MSYPSIEAYHQFLDNEYEDIRVNTVQTILAEGINPPTIRVMEDNRRNLGLIYPLPKEARLAIEEKVLSPLRKIFLEENSPQVVFGPDWLHVSALVIMGSEIVPPFDPENENVAAYGDIARQILADHLSFDVSFSRLTAFEGNTGGILLGGFPDTLEVDEVRDQLRMGFDVHHLRHFERRPLQIFHTTVARWDSRLEPQQAYGLIDFLDRIDHQEIWSGRVDKVELVNDGYNSSPQNTHIIETFNLS